MSASPVEILLMDNHLIAVNKPAGILTQSTSKNSPSLLELVRQWLKDEYQKPGKVYLGLVHRLEKPVSGVVLFARTSKAAGRLSQQFREHTVQKFYRACVEGIPENKKGSLTHFLRKEKSKKTTVFPRATPEAKEAELAYRVIESSADTSELEVILKTERFHQIRAQLSFLGHPVLGDTLYRSQRTLGGGQIALYASKLIFAHPVTHEQTTLEAQPPYSWTEHLRG